MADPRHNPPLPLRRQKPGKVDRPGMPRTTRKPVLTVVLSSNMGYDCNGCRVLVCNADTPEVAEGPL
jgi:hypothetical protein